MKQNVFIVLASESPRRKELLKQAGLDFKVITSNIDENTVYSEPDRIVMDLSEMKCRAVADKLSESYNEIKKIPEGYDKILIVAADTIVSRGGVSLGKPKNKEDAHLILRRLSGRTHEVYTGVSCVLLSRGEDKKIKETDSFGFFSETKVKMYRFSEDEIKDYIATGEPLDKAGAYGIQGIGERLVEYIKGDYNNVVGFPLSKFMKELAEREYISYKN